MIRSTHTYAVLKISHAAYAEIKSKLTAAGYSDQFHDDRYGDGVVIDMHGLALSDEGQTQAYYNLMFREKAELSEKVDKLETFINGSDFSALSPAEQTRLTRQHLIMQLYEQVLAERIAAFDSMPSPASMPVSAPAPEPRIVLDVTKICWPGDEPLA